MSSRPEQRADPAALETDRMPLTAFHALPNPAELMQIVPASRWREWMNATDNRFANRCLPLLMANESGWLLLNPDAFEAVWDGGKDRSAITVEFDGGTVPRCSFVESLFGHGILTWKIPYLFRTPPGYNMLARGPANWPKDGVSALEGVVETDWATATFTMNWKFTRPDHRVRFERDDPFCMIVPQRRGELESFDPAVRHASTDPPTARGWQLWAESRDRTRIQNFLGTYFEEYAEHGDSWEKDYFKGISADGREALEHQTKLRLREFAGDDSPDRGSDPPSGT